MAKKNRIGRVSEGPDDGNCCTARPDEGENEARSEYSPTLIQERLRANEDFTAKATAMNQWRFHIPHQGEDRPERTAHQWVATAWREATEEQVQALFDAGLVRADSVIVTRPNRPLRAETIVEFSTDRTGERTFGLPDVETLLWGDESVVVDKPVGVPGRIRSDDPTEPVRFMADLLGLDRARAEPVWTMPTNAGGPWLVAHNPDVGDRLRQQIADGQLQTTWTAITERPPKGRGSWQTSGGTVDYAVTRTEGGLAELQLTPRFRGGEGEEKGDYFRRLLATIAEAGYPAVGDGEHGGYMVVGALRMRLAALYGTDEFGHSWPAPSDWWPPISVATSLAKKAEPEPAKGEDSSAKIQQLEILLDEAIGRRLSFFRKMESTDVFRVVHGGADGLSGIYIDCIGPIWRVLSVSSAGRRRSELFCQMIADRDPSAMVIALDPRGDSGTERPAQIAHRGLSIIDEGDEVVVYEDGMRFVVLPWYGPEIGLRPERRLARRQAAGRAQKGQRWLHLGGGAGTFACLLATQGARVTNVDPSGQFEQWMDANFKQNGLSPDLGRYVSGDPDDYLNGVDHDFDGIIVDPRLFGENFQRERFQELLSKSLGLMSPGGSMLAFGADPLPGGSLEELVKDAARSAERSLDSLQPVPIPDDYRSEDRNPELIPFEALWIS